jgi:leucyl aminopeptidase
MERNFASGLLVAAAFTISQAGAAPAPLRLIQTGFETREWMNEAQIRELSQQVHMTGRCGGFKDVTDHEFRGLQPAVPFFAKTDPTEQATVEKLLLEVRATNLSETVKTLADFGTRDYKTGSGVKAAEWIRDRFKQLGHDRADVQTELFKHRFIQPSVIARIQGKGPHANEIVVIGGHLDSVNIQGGGHDQPNAPGADDDATGVATVIEAFRVLSESGFQPDRTLEFMGYAGEEYGLLGSQDIAEKYAEDGKQVVAVLQFDMTGFPGAGQALHLITDHTNPELTNFIKKLVDAYAKAPWKTARCGYGCSDHASWSDAGFASAFPFEADMDHDNKAIHSKNDTIEKLDFGFANSFARLAVGFLVELGRAP